MMTQKGYYWWNVIDTLPPSLAWAVEPNLPPIPPSPLPLFSTDISTRPTPMRSFSLNSPRHSLPLFTRLDTTMILILHVLFILWEEVTHVKKLKIITVSGICLLLWYLFIFFYPFFHTDTLSLITPSPTTILPHPTPPTAYPTEGVLLCHCASWRNLFPWFIPIRCPGVQVVSWPHRRDTPCDLQKSKSWLLYFFFLCILEFLCSWWRTQLWGLVEHHPIVLFYTSPAHTSPNKCQLIVREFQ